MKLLNEIFVSLFIALMISYALVIVFLGFGPMFIDGELGIFKANEYTLIAMAVVFWPVFYFRRRKSRKG